MSLPPHQRELRLISTIGMDYELNVSRRDIEQWIQTNPLLERVYVNYRFNRERDWRLLAVFRNPNVKEVRFSNNDDFPLEMLTRYIRYAPSLESLHFKHVDFRNVTRAKLSRFLQANRGLQELTLHTCTGLTRFVAPAMAHSLRYRTSFRKVTIWAYDMTTVGLLGFSDVLSQYSSLRVLNLYSMRLPFTETDAQVLANAIVGNETLEELYLDVYDRISFPSARRILNAVTVNHTLKDFSFDHLELGHEGSLVVARLIEENHTLESLRLHGSLSRRSEFDLDSFSHVGLNIIPISRALATNDTLKGIHFGHWVMLGADDSLQSMLRVNNTLEKLQIFSSHIDEQQIASFVRTLPQFAALKYLDLSDWRLTYDSSVLLRDSFHTLALSKNCISTVANSICLSSSNSLSKQKA